MNQYTALRETTFRRGSAFSLKRLYAAAYPPNDGGRAKSSAHVASSSTKFRFKSTLFSLKRRPLAMPNGLTTCTRMTVGASPAAAAPSASARALVARRLSSHASWIDDPQWPSTPCTPERCTTVRLALAPVPWNTATSTVRSAAASTASTCCSSAPAEVASRRNAARASRYVAWK